MGREFFALATTPKLRGYFAGLCISSVTLSLRFDEIEHERKFRETVLQM